jgi:hypothetical protein
VVIVVVEGEDEGGGGGSLVIVVVLLRWRIVVLVTISREGVVKTDREAVFGGRVIVVVVVGVTNIVRVSAEATSKGVSKRSTKKMVLCILMRVRSAARSTLPEELNVSYSFRVRKSLQIFASECFRHVEGEA